MGTIFWVKIRNIEGVWTWLGNRQTEVEMSPVWATNHYCNGTRLCANLNSIYDYYLYSFPCF